MAEVKVKKGIKRSFFEVVAPLTSTKIFLYAATKEELAGKVVKLDLTRSLRGKSLELRFRVKNQNGILEGDPIALELMGSFIRRMIRKGIDYVEDSFILETKDAKVIVKPFLITRNKVSRAVRNSLRENTRKNLEAHFKTRSTKELFSEIISNKIQKELSLKLKKIYPLALCEIRWFEIVEPLKESIAAKK